MAVARASVGRYAGNGYGAGGYAPGGIITGEAVSLDLRAARLPSRMIAGLIDLAINFFVVYLLLQSLGVALVNVLDTAALAAVLVVIAVAGLLGFPIAMQVFNGGRTIGKIAMGLRVVRDDGGPIAFRQALTRELVGFVVEKPGLIIPLAPGVVCSMLREDGKRIGDLAAGTLVISDRVAKVGHDLSAPMMPPQLAGWASTLDLSRLPDDVALRAREVLSRAPSLRPGAREELGAAMVAAITVAVGEPPPGAPGWAFVSAVLAERHRRDVIRLAKAREIAARRSGAPPPNPWLPPVPVRAVGMAAYDQPWSLV